MAQERGLEFSINRSVDGPSEACGRFNMDPSFGYFLLLIGFRSLKKIQKHQWKYIVVSSLLGTLFPAFFFAFAITGIDSSVASILNSLTSLNALIVAILFFGVVFKRVQLVGVLIGLVGTTLLILESSSLNPNCLNPNPYYSDEITQGTGLWSTFNTNNET